MRPDVNHLFFVSTAVYLVQNQTVTVQNGPNFRENLQLSEGSVVVLDVVLSSKFCANLS